jgi:hypothetical protein
MDATLASANDDGVCDVCGHAIVRDVFQDNSSIVITSTWLGVCGCAKRKWRSLTAIGEPPWDPID